MNMPQLSFSRKIIFVIIITSLFILAVILAAFYYLEYQKAQNIIQNSLSEQPEAVELSKKVARFISLPENETPTIATVSDYQKLKDQPFFEKSQNGDKVLIYTQAKKAYLYRPSTDQLIDVTIVNLNSADSPSSTSPTVQLAQPKIILRNGTSTSGLTAKLEPEIKKLFPGANIIKKENATSNDYPSTLIIILNEQQKEAASALADFFKATITSLPADETKPTEGDILIIIGKDKAL